jgi:hypothetical protein
MYVSVILNCFIISPASENSHSSHVDIMEYRKLKI